MTALVLIEGLAIGLLGLLVAGLLRSHAEILRRLHDLDPAAAHAGAGSPVAAPRRRTPTVTSLTGTTVAGETTVMSLDRRDEQRLLLFLSSGCGTCAPWWDGLRDGEAGTALPGVDVVVVARDPDEESPAMLAGLAAGRTTVLMSSLAWEQFEVPGSPYAVLLRGGTVVGSGVAQSWRQLASLIARRDTDAELHAAGILPGDPSLYPEPGSWT